MKQFVKGKKYRHHTGYSGEEPLVFTCITADEEVGLWNIKWATLRSPEPYSEMECNRTYCETPEENCHDNSYWEAVNIL